MYLRFAILAGCLAATSGCSLLPERICQPTIHNPFPQLSRVAVTPFFNHSHEATLDCRQVAEAYFNELQTVPGFEVVPVSVVETAMLQHNIVLRGAADARRLAQVLGVDAVVIGAVTDYSPYYPPRCGLQIEWYAANPGFHPIPPGYGLPWGTIEEQNIPGPLIFEAEFALAREQLKTQTPPMPTALPGATGPAESGRRTKEPPSRLAAAKKGEAVRAGEPVPPKPEPIPPGTASNDSNGGGDPTYWPDPRGFIPPPPGPRPPSWPTDAPVLRHTRIYNGNDTQFTASLESYYVSRDEARFDGWQGYLQRSDDFLRFCCHMHIWEMLTARGGAGETRVVWRWPTIR
jgi:hypothetical protein